MQNTAVDSVTTCTWPQIAYSNSVVSWENALFKTKHIKRCHVKVWRLENQFSMPRWWRKFMIIKQAQLLALLINFRNILTHWTMLSCFWIDPNIFCYWFNAEHKQSREIFFFPLLTCCVTSWMSWSSLSWRVIDIRVCSAQWP